MKTRLTFAALFGICMATLVAQNQAPEFPRASDALERVTWRTRTLVANDRFTNWSGVQGGIAVVSARGDSLRLLDSLGREIFRTGFDTAEGLAGLVAPSPEGRELAVFPIAPPEPNADGDYEGPVYRISPPEGLPRVVARVRGGDASFRPFVWTDDGWLHYIMWFTASERRPRLYRVRADGGDQQVEGELPFGRDGFCSISGNGKRWACVVSQPLSDLYLIRNFDAEH